ncbi:MAG: hypothetical protein ABI693_25685 [Bryobacteraceae bacterium]
MSQPAVAQLKPLADLFAQALSFCRPASVALLGIAGGNGLDRIDPQITHRTLGIDIHPDYLEAVRARYATLPGLELHCLDLAAASVDLQPCALVHAALLFEHAGATSCLANALALVEPEGHFSVVLQLPSETEPGVSTTPYASIGNLKSAFTLLDPDWFIQTLNSHACRLLHETRHPLASGKGLWLGIFQKE